MMCGRLNRSKRLAFACVFVVLPSFDRLAVEPGGTSEPPLQFVIEAIKYHQELVKDVQFRFKEVMDWRTVPESERPVGLDDLLLTQEFEWAQKGSKIYNKIIDSRYAEENTTIITSNTNITEFKDVAKGRVYSRILEMCRIIHVDLPDYREKLSQFI